MKTEELIDIMMYLITNLLGRLQAHHDQLAIFTGEQNLSEIIVLQGLFLDGSNITCHNLILHSEQQLDPKTYPLFIIFYFPPENKRAASTVGQPY